MRPETLIDPRIDRRLDQHFKKRSSRDLGHAQSRTSIVILSYGDDEGVRLNRGRPGAHEGPARILHYLGRMVQLQSSPEIILISDAFSQLNLSERHSAAEEALHHAYQKGYRILSLGGGHDYGYPDGSAFLKNFKGKILNVDAHLDVRPVIDGNLNSGTAFSRLAEKFGGQKIIQWGVQAHCNAEAQVRWAKSKKMKIIPFGKKLPPLSGKLGLSICMDAFQGIRGVSAPALVGLEPREALSLIDRVKSRAPWLGLYEASPRHDPQTEDSARLAAVFAFHFIHLDSGVLK